ncbi:MAG: PQQ-binding-like beta-propeller repeat protein [Nocardioidaceae bacterium]|nr:PQQ-binding-like beta-propeller repeat protein [Nocardioidaceae bacterium]
MTISRRALLRASVAGGIFAVAPACGAGEPDRLGLDGTPAPPDPNADVEIATGVTLHPGEDGTLPVTVRWKREIAVPEAMAVDGDRVYVADEVPRAFALDDGTLIWETRMPGDEGFGSDGGTVIGLEGPHRLRFWAPYNSDVVVDRETGRFISARLADGRDVPRGMHPFPTPVPPQYDFGPLDQLDPEQLTARDRSGRVAWRITVQHPQFQYLRPTGIPGGLLVAVTSGHLVRLDLR